MSKPTIKILPAVIIAITAVWGTQPVFGGAPTATPTPSTSVVITFTENSSASLTAIYTDPMGGMLSLVVNNTSADHWTVDLPTYLVTATSNQWLPWAEPELVAPIKGNVVSPSGSNSFAVSSDVAITGFVDNGDFSSTWIAIDNSGAGGVAVFGRFNDLGDASSAVPDTERPFPFLGFLSWA